VSEATLAAFICRYSAASLPEGTHERVGAWLIATAEGLEDPEKRQEVSTWRVPSDPARAAQAAWQTGASWAAARGPNARATFYANLLSALFDEMRAKEDAGV
jgi:hypothetical protein